MRGDGRDEEDAFGEDHATAAKAASFRVRDSPGWKPGASTVLQAVLSNLGNREAVTDITNPVEALGTDLPEGYPCESAFLLAKGSQLNIALSRWKPVSATTYCLFSA